MKHKRAQQIAGLVAYAALATPMAIALMLGAKKLPLLGSPSSFLAWSVLPIAGFWIASSPHATDIYQSISGRLVRRRNAIPLWIPGPWLAYAFGNISVLAALLYYVPMIVGLVVRVRLEQKDEDARAVVMPGLRWSEPSEGTFLLEIPDAGAARSRLEAAGDLLLRDSSAGGPEVLLSRSYRLNAHSSLNRLTVELPRDHALFSSSAGEAIAVQVHRA